VPNSQPNCPNCESASTYPERQNLNCAECGFEWDPNQKSSKEQKSDAAVNQVSDAFGNALATGDSVTVLKELKIKGASSSVKVGTKVKNIRIVDGDDGHNISCKIDGVGAIFLKSEFVRKV
jgi:protein PhnA